MTWKDFWDCPEEIIIGGICSSIFLYWIIGWPVFAISGLSGLLWRAGGVRGGNKLFRRLGVPLLICGACYAARHQWQIFLAIPFMVWLAPSYGIDSWLRKRVKDDFLARTICFGWYWSAFGLAYYMGILGS
jgi:hypothetical protein